MSAFIFPMPGVGEAAFAADGGTVSEKGYDLAVEPGVAHKHMALGEDRFHCGGLVVDHFDTVPAGFPHAGRLTAVQDDIAGFYLGGRNHEEQSVAEAEDQIVAVAEFSGPCIVTPVTRGSLDRDPAGGQHAQPFLNFHEHSVKHCIHPLALLCY